MDNFLTFRVEIPGAVFLIVVVVAIFLMFVAMFQFRRIRHQQVNAVASILIVIGVLGTFVGITLGLLAFDAETVETIEASIPQLLGGLRIAFVTSILGILSSIIFKWSTLNDRRKESVSKDSHFGTTLDDLARLLENIHAVEQNEGKATRESLLSIEKSLTGEGDATVLSQIQKLKATISGKQDELIQSFNEFAKKIADDNTKALIQALEEVMREFNAKINEQFGNNFKQLNEAVGKVNRWQEQYRKQMDELAEEFRIAAESVERSRESLEIIANRSDAIVVSAEQLGPTLQALAHQVEHAENHLEAFSGLADNARNAFPIIETRLEQLTGDFSTAVKEAIDDSHKSVEKQNQALHTQYQQLEQTIRDTVKSMENQVKTLDTALRSELTTALNTSLNSLGSHLTSLSRKFVDDYSELTDRLREVVQISSRLPRTRSYDTPDDIPF